MRLRSIPPRTMTTRVVRGPGGSPLNERLLAFRERLAALRQRLLQHSAGDGLSPALAGLRAGRAAAAASPRLQQQTEGKHGHMYRRRPVQRNDMQIAPRPGPGRAAVIAAVSVTPEGHAVRIEFPAPVRREDLRWELHGDVLEVEHLGRAFAYDHAFLVPAGRTPMLEHEERAVTFRFAQAEG